MPACKQCGGKGWLTLSLGDFRGYWAPSIPFPCDCKAGEQWALEREQERAGMQEPRDE